MKSSLDLVRDKYEKETEDFKKKSLDEVDFNVSPSLSSKRLPSTEVVEQFVEAVTRSSEETTRSRSIHLKANVPYGSTEKQCFDILSQDGQYKNTSIVVFFHGGYWMELSRERFYFIGRPMIEKGATFITVGYDLAPEASLTEIVKQASKSLECIVKLAEEWNCKDIYLSGHSAGGYLALMSACGSQNLANICQYLKGFILLSGVYDLRPLKLSSLNDVLKVTEKEAKDLNLLSEKMPMQMCKYLKHSKFLLTLPEYDAPEFGRQARLLHQILLHHGISVELMELNGKDHFDSIELLFQPDYELTEKILDFIEINK